VCQAGADHLLGRPRAQNTRARPGRGGRGAAWAAARPGRTLAPTIGCSPSSRAARPSTSPTPSGPRCCASLCRSRSCRPRRWRPRRPTTARSWVCAAPRAAPRPAALRRTASRAAHELLKQRSAGSWPPHTLARAARRCDQACRTGGLSTCLCAALHARTVQVHAERPRALACAQCGTTRTHGTCRSCCTT